MTIEVAIARGSVDSPRPEVASNVGGKPPSKAKGPPTFTAAVPRPHPYGASGHLPSWQPSDSHAPFPSTWSGVSDLANHSLFSDQPRPLPSLATFDIPGRAEAPPRQANPLPPGGDA